ncbi:two-component sensor histidine kinase [Sulfurimonas gotlandica GD1]|uniref:histidine kinase n=1 Tax=Sulfurimonas gotlandica (strain DSM 19862 / JCM 16533 / GD1) TaxID=929558 RepID=B6BHX9_SULGG|nr:HAMP domain-containing sensor histidine kinase [Sulfurimonas gotlandica]EDZ63458.1 PAS/PAC sensor signal transduction histidine kinase [Sulfurimonas gotlandica GD1]EHP30131.1 two-component sensor histidine kinase [Sulfurimonas gotlandica GD1]
MSNKITQILLNEIVNLSKKSDKKLAEKIQTVLDFYITEQKENQKTIKQNEYFLKQWDKRNIIAHERDAKKDKLLEQQSRLASMGEMIDAIAHQWKQPLNSMSMMSDMMQEDFENGLVNSAYVKEFNDTVHMQIDHMVSTLHEFRTFFRPSTKNEEFTIQDAMNSVGILMKDELISQNILLDIDIDSEIKIFGNQNEFKHLFINLINNSIDSFNDKNINHRNINIRCYEENTNIYIEVEDNAGGIPNEVIKDIFKPNVTTKPEGKGTGIGLYMSEQIVKKNHGTINVYNTAAGAFFTITLRQATI